LPITLPPQVAHALHGASSTDIWGFTNKNRNPKCVLTQNSGVTHLETPNSGRKKPAILLWFSRSKTVDDPISAEAWIHGFFNREMIQWPKYLSDIQVSEI